MNGCRDNVTDGRDRKLWEADNEGGIEESIERFIEDQASSQSYVLAPRSPSPPRLPSVSHSTGEERKTEKERLVL
jgi:hypothetical protein